MAIARSRLTILGDFNSGAEQWATGFHMGEFIGVTDAEGQDVANAIDALFQSEVWSGAYHGLIPDRVRYLGVKVADIRSNNVTERQWTAGPGSPLPGGTDAAPLPPQIAPVLSLRTEYPGSRNRGRMYTPNPTHAAIGSDGRLTATFTGAAVVAWSDFMKGVNSSAVDVTVCIYSPTQSLLREVRSVRMGTVADTQRRRRDELTETFTSETL